MKLSQIKTILEKVDGVNFKLPNGSYVPEHFHVTEIGLITKSFIDCGGTVRNETVVNFQLWNANDVDHRLKPKKLLNIIELSEKKLGIQDFEIEVEYQDTTIGKYSLEFNGKEFELINTQTTCLAQDQCDIQQSKSKIRRSDLNNENSCYIPNGGCC